MIFQCADLERALRLPDLMPDAKAHAERCERCREELYVWSEISRIAPELHHEWESSSLWPRIRADLERAAFADKSVRRWQWLAAAAALIAMAVALSLPWGFRKPPNRAFLTESALHEVEQAEAAYARSIEKLSVLADPELERSPSRLAAAYREKLVVLDSAIADLKANVANNQYNVYVQDQLASLYREKQKTLQEWLEYAKGN